MSTTRTTKPGDLLFPCWDKTANHPLIKKSSVAWKVTKLLKNGKIRARCTLDFNPCKTIMRSWVRASSLQQKESDAARFLSDFNTVQKRTRANRSSKIKFAK